MDNLIYRDSGQDHAGQAVHTNDGLLRTSKASTVPISYVLLRKAVLPHTAL